MRQILPLLLAGAVGCTAPLKLAKDDSKTVLAEHSLTASDPSKPGTFAVKYLTYGNGTDQRRAAFRDSIAIKTRTIDGSPFVSAPPEILKPRTKYWGFDLKKLPLNGRVWYPDGDGPFPLVLIVHGNHNMRDFSDPGYEYLGQLLASRGFILVSVDENFINGNLRGENDARGLMLLEHLKAWRAFNDSAGRPFHRKVDFENIGIMGHSRGGEAVAIAAAFNRLKHYPDDATRAFDYNFSIKAVVAIAPVDGQYQPANKPTPVENVNYLVIHGSHDGDVSSFNGLRQFQRVRFTDGRPWFKSAVYVYRANHGQWNSVWKNKDNGPRSARFLDLRGLIPEEDQAQFGKAYIGAFLEATLHNKREYLPMFRDHRVAANWLPKTMYLTRFQENGFRALASFEEDVDVTTGAVHGVVLQGDSLSTWKEGIIPSRGNGSDIGTNGVWLGWNNKPVGKDTLTPRAPATFTVTISDSVRNAWNVNQATSLVFSLAPTDAKPGPRRTSARPDSSAKTDSAKKPAPAKPKGNQPKPPPAKPDTTPIDVTVEVVDAAGHTARLQISRYGVPRKPLEIYVLRRKGYDKARFANLYELVLQTYVVPFADFVRASEGFDPTRLKSVRFVFDRVAQGTVVLDDVGLSAMDNAFLAAKR
jgi:dienelactone hydrolase